MTEAIRVDELPELDPGEHLRDEGDIAAYLTQVIKDGDPSELAHALGVAARSRGMTEVAAASGMAREGLYKALHAGAQPRFDTVNRVCHALGLKPGVQPVAKVPEDR